MTYCWCLITVSLSSTSISFWWKILFLTHFFVSKSSANRIVRSVNLWIPFSVLHRNGYFIVISPPTLNKCKSRHISFVKRHLKTLKPKEAEKKFELQNSALVLQRISNNFLMQTISIYITSLDRLENRAYFCSGCVKEKINDTNNT